MTRYRGRQGLESFRQMVDASLVRQQLGGLGDHFRATVRQGDLGRVRLLQADVPALTARRGPRDVQTEEGHVYLLLGGVSSARLRHVGGDVPVDAGHLTVIPAAAAFEIAYPDRARVVFATIDAATVALRHPWLEGPIRSVPLTPAVGGLYRSAIAAALVDHAEGGPHRHDLAEVILTVLAMAARGRTGVDATTDVLTSLRARAVALIDANLEHPDLSPRWLADQTHCSLRQMHRAFTAAGTTPAAVIRRRRLQRAAELLTDSSASVLEIAHRLRFSSASHLSRRFAEHFGHPPSRWRAHVPEQGTQVHEAGR